MQGSHTSGWHFIYVDYMLGGGSGVWLVFQWETEEEGGEWHSLLDQASHWSKFAPSLKVQFGLSLNCFFLRETFLPILSEVALSPVPFFLTASFSSPSEHFPSFVSMWYFVIIHLRAVFPTSLMVSHWCGVARWLRAWAEESDELGFQSGLTTYWLCDPGKVTYLFGALISSPWKDVRIIMSSLKPGYGGKI